MTGNLQAGRLSPLTQTLFDNSQAGANYVKKPAFLIAQCLTTVPLAVYPAFSVTGVQALCGRGSNMDRMFQKYFKLDNQGPIYIVPQADATGAAAATGSFTTAGTATAAGTLSLYIAGQNVNVGVAVGDTAVAITANAVAVINANLDLPVTASAVAAGDATLRKCLLTARHAGLCGNQIDLRLNYYGIRNSEAVPAGLTCVALGMTGGTLNPSLSAAYAVIGDAPGRIFVDAYTDAPSNTAAASALSFSGGRWDPTRKVWGHRFSAISGLPGALTTFASGNDDPHTSYFAYETGAPTPEWEAAGMWAGAMAISLRAQPNQPVQTLPMPDFMPPLQGLESAGGPFQATTRETLLQAGLGCARYDRGSPQIVRSVTSYTTNALGSPDQSYQDTQDLFWCMAFADYIEAMETQKLPRALLATNGTKVAPGLPVITPKGFLGLMIAVYNQMQFDGLVDDATDFIAMSSAVADQVTAGRLNVLWAPFMIVGLFQIANTVQFRKVQGAAVSVLNN
jgi:phage tail sheath gpL-like